MILVKGMAGAPHYLPEVFICFQSFKMMTSCFRNITSHQKAYRLAKSLLNEDILPTLFFNKCNSKVFMVFTIFNHMRTRYKNSFFFKYRLLFECRMNMLKISLDESFYNANHQAINFAVIYRKRISAGFLLSKLISISKINQQIARHIKKLNKLIPCILAIYYSRMCNFQLFIVTT